MSSPSASQGRYPYQSEPTWSRSEKVIAREVLKAALKRELRELMQETKRMAGQVTKPADMWALERYLTQRRKEIDGKYEFRSSRLTQTFGRLLCERRVSEDERNRPFGERPRR